MDHSPDPHRGLDALHTLGGSSEMLRPPDQLLSVATASSSNETRTGGTNFNTIDLGWQFVGANSADLAHSWLLILFVAPILIVPLIWLLILLSQRANQARLLLVSGLPERSSSVQLIKQLQPHVASNQGKQQQHVNSTSSSSANHYLLDQTSSSSGSSSSSSSEGSASNDEANHQQASSSSKVASKNGTNQRQQQQQQHQQVVAHLDQSDVADACTSCERRQIKAENQLLGALRSLAEHMHLYLITLTYQEIVGCLVSFMIAILNVVRMRNLFSCNLVIFILITSKLLNLLTLTTFTLTKLVKLLRLKPLKSIAHQNHLRPTSYCISNNNNNNHHHQLRQQANSVRTAIVEEKSSAHTEGSVILTERPTSEDDSLQVYVNSTTTTTATSGCSASTSDKQKQQQQAESGARKRHCSSPFENSATISRLIVKESSESAKQRGTDLSVSSSSSAGEGGSNASDSFCYLSTASSSSSLNQHVCSRKQTAYLDNKQEPIACRMMLLFFLSASMAIFCLYLRLMPSIALTTVGVVEQQQVGLIQTNRSTWSSAQDSSTRYTTTSAPASAAEANYQTGSWVSRIQQSGQLRQLIDQYKLETFAHLLLDTQLQTSRFMCTLAAGKYAQTTKLVMLCIFGSLMFLILLSSLAIRRLGKQKLHRFDLATSLAHQLYQPELLKMPIPSKLANQHYQLPLDPLYLLSGPKQTDSNRKRYSELLKQNMRRHQSALEVLAGAHSRMGHFAGFGMTRHSASRGELRNSSSLSSLLAPTKSAFWAASSERQPQNRLAPHLPLSRQQHQQLRKLMGAQSLANLSQLTPNGYGNSGVGSKLLPAGKLANSSGHLAWLPLGSAATVASLSNIVQTPVNSSTHTHHQSSTGGSSRGKQQQQQQLKRPYAACTPPRTRGEPLGSIGEHLATENSVDSKGSRVKKSYQAARRGAQTSGQQQVQKSVAAHTSSIQQHQHQQQQQHYEIALNRLACLELKRDLRLAQTVILYGQLLNHAPILILLALSSFLPEGLLTSWNSTHDNAFVWLTLIQAIALPIILCSVDTRLALALRRSLRCSSKAEQLSPTSTFRPSFSSHRAHAYQGAGAALPTHNLLTCDKLGQTRLANYGNDLVLGPSASYPDFMFVCPRKSTSTSASKVTPPGAQYSPRFTSTGQARASFTCRSLTGPPYPPASARPLAVDTNRESLRANFALITKAGTYQQQQQQMFLARLTAGKLGPAVSPHLVHRRRRRRRAGAILSATRKLFRLHREPNLRKSRVHTSSSSSSTGYLHQEQVGETSTDNNTTSSRRGNHQRGKLASGNRTGRMSPTSSLSTLIRKFNHDNYTNVCQQYEQRTQQIAVESSQLKLLDQATVSSEQKLLIGSLDGSVERGSSSDKNLTSTGNLIDQPALADGKDGAEILCRKGGLYYNYCLDASSEPQVTSSGTRITSTSRVNPILLNTCFTKVPTQSGQVTGEQNKSSENLLKVLADESSTIVDSSVATSGKTEQLHRTNFTQEPQSDFSHPLQLQQTTEACKKNESNKAISGGNNNKSSNKERKSTQNLTTAPEGRAVGQKSASKSSNTNKNSNNNEQTIISNISSVQELLDKMNGIINGNKQVELDQQLTSGKHADAVKADESSCGLTKQEAASFSCGKSNFKANNSKNKSIVEMVTNHNSNKSHNNPRTGEQLQSATTTNTCSNQLRQLTTAVGKPVEGAGVAATTIVEPKTIHHLMSDGTLDYASLRSMEDALSLVSVSSEFEYHNIHQTPQLHQVADSSTKEQTSTAISTKNHWFAEPARATTNQSKWSSLVELKEQEEENQVVPSRGDKSKQHNENSQKVTTRSDSRPHELSKLSDIGQKKADNNNNSNLMLVMPSSQPTNSSSSSSSSSMDNKRLEDLRFPSFLPTKHSVGQPADDSRRFTGPSSKSALPVVSKPGVKRNNQAEQSALLTPTKSNQKLPKTNEEQQQRQSAPISSSISTTGLNNNNNSPSNNSNNRPPSNSSSLLNLSIAKFTALSSGNDQLVKHLVNQRLEGSGNTITKHKASAGDRVVTLGEFSSAQSNQLLQSGIVEGNILPTESGNVRARIRKMEQQSTPNLNSSQQLVTKATTSGTSTDSAGKRRLGNQNIPVASLIPTATSSKLPIPVHSSQNPLNISGSNSKFANFQNNQKVLHPQRQFSSDGQHRRPKPNTSAKHYS